MVETTMDVAGWLRKQVETASPDLLRAMVQDFAEALIGAEADALCSAPYGEQSLERSIGATATASATGTNGLARSSSPSRSCATGPTSLDWLLQPRRRAEQAFVSVIADAHMAGAFLEGARSAAAPDDLQH